MCLTTSQYKPVVNEADIVVYKRLREGDTSYNSFLYEVGVIQPNVKMLEYEEPQEFNLNIEQGYHSWATKGGHDMKANAVFVIPRGALVYTGIQYDGSIGFASNTIIFVGRRWKLSTWWRLIRKKYTS